MRSHTYPPNVCAFGLCFNQRVPDRAISDFKSPIEPRYLPTLDGWRTIAIFGVILCHAFPDSALALKGQIGVNLFFAISGLLICYRLLAGEEREGKIDLKSFYLRRAFRILPPAFFYLFVLVILNKPMHTLVHPWREICASAFFFRNMAAAGNSGWFTAHYWSLSVEEHFYLLFPWLLVLVAPRKRKLWIIVIALLLTGWRAVAPHENPLRTDLNLFGLMWGAAMAVWLQTPRFRQTMLRVTAGPVGLLLMLACLLAVLWNGSLAGALRAILFPVTLAATMLHRDTFLSRVLEWYPLRRIGQISYSLYLWQQFFIVRSHSVFFIQRLPISLAFLLITAWLSYTFLEQPLMKLGRRIDNQRKKRTPDPPSDLTLRELGPSSA
jgi:peptidoglycan/LPS O-acetylase OafA/YrhL